MFNKQCNAQKCTFALFMNALCKIPYLKFGALLGTDIENVFTKDNYVA